MDLIRMTQSVDHFFWTDDEIFEPSVESETFELFCRDGGNPIFKLISFGVFYSLDSHSMRKNLLGVINNETIEQFIVSSRETGECLDIQSITQRSTIRSLFRKQPSTIAVYDLSLTARDIIGGANT